MFLIGFFSRVVKNQNCVVKSYELNKISVNMPSNGSAIYTVQKLVVANFFLRIDDSQCNRINSLPNKKILDQSKLKAIAEDMIIVTHKLKFV